MNDSLDFLVARYINVKYSLSLCFICFCYTHLFVRGLSVATFRCGEAQSAVGVRSRVTRE